MLLFILGYSLCLGICLMLLAVNNPKALDVDSLIIGFGVTCLSIASIGA